MCLHSGRRGIKPGAGGCSQASRGVERGQIPGSEEKGAGVGSLTFQNRNRLEIRGNGGLDLDTVSNWAV